MRLLGGKPVLLGTGDGVREDTEAELSGSRVARDLTALAKGLHFTSMITLGRGAV